MPRKKSSNQKSRQQQRNTRRKARHELLRAHLAKAHAGLEEWKPNIVFDTTTGHPEFIRLIREKVAALPVTDRSSFPPHMILLYRILKSSGPLAVATAIELHSPGPAERDIILSRFSSHIGTVIFNSMTDEEKDRFIPFHDVLFRPEVNGSITCRFSALETKRLNGDPLTYEQQPCFYSSHRPTVSFDGAGKIVAFTKHAIQRICERLVPNWRTYEGLGEAYGFFRDCMYYENAEIRPSNRKPGRQRAITFYQDCFLDHFRVESLSRPHEYFMHVIGPLPENLTKHWYYRVGYCPVEIRGEFAVATTFLPPGFSATPEYALLEKSGTDQKEKRRLLKLATSLERLSLSLWPNLELTKWFHNNGIPQLKDLPGEVFAPPPGISTKRSLPHESPMSDFAKSWDTNKALEATTRTENKE